MSEPTTPTGRLEWEWAAGDIPESLRARHRAAILAIEVEAKAGERERLRAHTPDPRFGTDYIDCRCGWQAPRPGLFVWWTAHVFADPEPQP